MGLTPESVVAGLVFALGAVTWRGRRRVLRRLGELDRTQPRPSAALSALGRRIASALGAETDDEAFVGAAAFAVPALALAFGLTGGLIAAAAAATMLRARRRARSRARKHRIERALPEVVDLLSLVIGAGRPTLAALREVAPRTPAPFRDELSAVVRRAEAGEPLVESIRRLTSRLGPSTASLVYAVTSAETDGVPLRPALERVADEAHRRRRVRASEAARRVPVLMLFPLVFCILPAFCLLTVVPLLVGSIADLQLPSGGSK